MCSMASQIMHAWSVLSHTCKLELRRLQKRQVSCDFPTVRTPMRTCTNVFCHMNSEFRCIKLLGFPDYHKDPANWNRCWERLFKVVRSLDLRVLQQQTTRVMPDIDEQGLLSNYRS